MTTGFGGDCVTGPPQALGQLGWARSQYGVGVAPAVHLASGRGEAPGLVPQDPYLY